jgi:hypothetical protein
MAKRTNQTFAKRQRENARREKQQRKTAKRLERRQQAATRPAEPFGELPEGGVDAIALEPSEAGAEIPGEPETVA